MFAHRHRAAWLAAAAALLLPGGLLLVGAVWLYRWLRREPFLGEGRLRRETVEGFPLFVGRRGPSL